MIAASCDVFEVTREELLRRRRGTRNIPRSLTVLACRDMTPATGRELGAAFGIHPSTVSWIAKQAASLAGTDPDVARLLAALKRTLIT